MVFSLKSTKLSRTLIIAVFPERRRSQLSETLISVNFPSLLAEPPSAQSCARDSQSHFPLLSLFHPVRKHIYPAARLSTRLKTNAAALHWASSRLPAAAAAGRWRRRHEVAVYASNFSVVQPFVAPVLQHKILSESVIPPRRFRAPLLCPGHCAALTAPPRANHCGKPLDLKDVWPNDYEKHPAQRKQKR